MDSPSSATASSHNEVEAIVNNVISFVKSNTVIASASTSRDVRDNLERLLGFLDQEHAQVQRARHTFRRLGGFDTILTILDKCVSSVELYSTSVDDLILCLELINFCLRLLTDESTPRNPSYQNDRLIWQRAEASLLRLLEFDSVTSSTSRPYPINVARLFDVVLCVAIGKEPSPRVFEADAVNEESDWPKTPGLDLVSGSTLRQPWGLRVLTAFSIHIWTKCNCAAVRADGTGSGPDADHSQGIRRESLPSILQLAVKGLIVVHRLISLNERNLIGYQGTGALTIILSSLLSGDQDSSFRGLLRSLAVSLFQVGFSGLADAVQLISTPPEKAPPGLLLDTVEASHNAPQIVFDLSHCGYASIEFPELRQPFPPPAPAKGYSLMFWMRVDRFDDACHTTLFGAFDATQQCFVLVYLDRRNQSLVLQTSVSSNEPSVRFKAVNFAPGIYYHITLVHRRSRRDGTGRASLFINGIFREQVRCQLPDSPPLVSLKGVGPTGSTKAPATVQAFFGTPQMLSQSPGSGELRSQWSLGTAHLLNEVLHEEMIFVYYQLGQLYKGNFQDTLGSFQTYRASASVNLENEKLHPGHENDSLISAAVKSPAGKVNDESNFLISISAKFLRSRASLRSDGLRGPIRVANSATGLATGHSYVIANAAIPSLYKTISRKAASASILGGTDVIQGFSMQDASWRLFGCQPLILSMVAKAETPDQLLDAVRISFESFNHDWRSSEAMERGGGYGVLSWLLRKKLLIDDQTISTQDGLSIVNIKVETPGQLETLALSLLRSTLQYTTLNYDSVSKALIANPLAYRMIIIDNDLWQYAGGEAQQLYFEQIAIFLSHSEYRDFNAKRLTRMRLLKRLIEVSKSIPVGARVCTPMMGVFKALLAHTASADTLRSIALYITYAIHKSRYWRVGKATAESSGTQSNASLTEHELGVRNLQTLCEFLCKAHEDVMRRFARSVTTRWLLHLLESDDAPIVEYALRILSRMLVVAGDSYRNKFESKNGYMILAAVLRRWCFRQTIWLSALSLLFGIDASESGLHGLEDLTRWLTSDHAHVMPTVACPRAWDSMMAMLEEGLRQRCQCDTEQTGIEDAQSGTQPNGNAYSSTDEEETLRYVVSLLKALFDHLDSFHCFVSTSEVMRSVLTTLFSAAVDVPDHPEAGPEMAVITNDVEPSDEGSASRAVSELTTSRHRRVSEFVVLNQSSNHNSTKDPSFSRPLAPANNWTDTQLPQNRCYIDTMRFFTSIAMGQIVSEKDFTGLGLFLKAPSASTAKRSWFNSLLQSSIIGTLEQRLDTDPMLFKSSKIITNLVRFMDQSCNAAIEGWFLDPTCALIRLMATFLRSVEQRDIRQLKSVRLCAPSIASTQHILLSFVLFQLGMVTRAIEDRLRVPEELHGTHKDNNDSSQFETSLCHVLIKTSSMVLATTDGDRLAESPIRADPRLVPAFCYLLFQLLVKGTENTRLDALQIFRQLTVPNLDEVRSCFKATGSRDSNEIAENFISKLLRSDDATTLRYLFDHQLALGTLLSDVPRAALDSIIYESNNKTEQETKLRLLRRQDRLHAAHLRDLAQQHALTEHDSSSKSWHENIYQSEAYKATRSRQDRSENDSHCTALFLTCSRKFQELLHPDAGQDRKWALDESEGRDRMRLRLAPGSNASDLSYKPKRSTRSNTMPLTKPAAHSQPRRRALTVTQSSAGIDGTTAEAPSQAKGNHVADRPRPLDEDEFELVVGPTPIDDGEDKNRKVMRSLQQGEQVHKVYNVSRIRGLEACEGLLIVGSKALYLVDNLFQRADSEIVNTSDAPGEERDPYIQEISGRSVDRPDLSPSSHTTTTRHWPWKAVISVSKRNFLLRPAAIELFFDDGRSYLLTASSASIRDKMYKDLTERSIRLQLSSTAASNQDAWRSELLVSAKEPSASMTGRFASALNFGASFPMTSKWVKGELSNFQYLMLVNTFAGRTFNDLTQYPVFPWVLSDYTSQELDLTNPRTFRDFSKPMGCQNLERETLFRDRHKTFAEMSDEPAFHYGTHYSTAMIVASYLIRLQPYVDSYLLLQGGSFDHADRLFYSMEKAWTSASQLNMTDVRELTPEFFYLPEMFTNINGYDFGRRDATGDLINDVQLPPWAKGDPKIFTAKHREALESPYVSQSLHQWIDLVFGFKQRGDAAVEATNVFHYLSYQGSTDLDTIEDPRERLATIGIIHNFGQTPQQVFGRPHEQRESTVSKSRRLHRSIEHLSASPTVMFEYHSCICEIDYFTKQQRLMCAGPRRSFMHPSYDIVLDWGYVDGSVRFWRADVKRTQPLAIYEQLHQEEISAVVFAYKILVTASRDCTVALWNVTPSKDSETVDLQPETFLFGHREAVSILAVSTVLSLILSADVTGRVLLWDLNTHERMREMKLDIPINFAKINSTTGHIVFACADRILLYTINGELILDQQVGIIPDDSINCCAFYETSGNDWLDTELIFTGHRRGLANIWKVTFDDRGTWVLQLVRCLDHVDRSPSQARSSAADITAVHPTDTSVYTGDEAGRVFEWKCTR